MEMGRIRESAYYFNVFGITKKKRKTTLANFYKELKRETQKINNFSNWVLFTLVESTTQFDSKKNLHRMNSATTVHFTNFIFLRNFIAFLYCFWLWHYISIDI